MKRKRIKDNTFNTYCELCLDCSEREFLNFINKKHKTNYEPTTALGKSVCHRKDSGINYYIWVNKKDDYVTLAHEVLHLIRFWLQDYYGINLTEETEEIYTLLHSFYLNKTINIKKI